MANESVSSIPTARGHFLLPSTDIDRGTSLIHQIRAIVDLMGCAAGGTFNPPSDQSMPNAAQAVDDMLQELTGIVTRKQAEG